MSESGEKNHSPEAILQGSLSKYNADVTRLCEQFPPAIEASERNPKSKIITHETSKYTVELPDGTPRTVSYASYPNGIEWSSTLRTVTIIADPVEGLGKWMTNYNLHELNDGTIATEYEHWFMMDYAVREAMEQNPASPSVTAGVERQEMATIPDIEDQAAVITDLKEAMTTPDFEPVTKEEISLLQQHIDTLL